VKQENNVRSNGRKTLLENWKILTKTTMKYYCKKKKTLSGFPSRPQACFNTDIIIYRIHAPKN
jgi:hypothetical protein